MRRVKSGFIRFCLLVIWLAPCLFGYGDEPKASVLVASLKQFEQQYYGCRLEISSNVVPFVLINSSKDGSVFSIEVKNLGSAKEYTGSDFTARWISKKHTLNLYSGQMAAGALGNLTGCFVGDSLFGLSSEDLMKLSELLESAGSESKVIRREPGWTLLARVPQKGLYQIFFEEVAAHHDGYRLVGWKINKTIGDSIRTQSTDYVVGGSSASDGFTIGDITYSGVAGFADEIRIDAWDSLGRPNVVSQSIKHQQKGETQFRNPLQSFPEWHTYTVDRCVGANNSVERDQVAFENLEVPKEMAITIFRGGGESYMLRNGTLVKVVNSKSLNHLNDVMPFRQKGSNTWSWYVVLLGIFLLSGLWFVFRHKRRR